MKKKLTALVLAASTICTSIGGYVNIVSAEEETIKIGVIAPMTGDRADAGYNVEYSIELAIEDVNANGGVLGKQVELVLEDSKADPKEAVELARKMAENDEICAVIGPLTSPEAIACSPIFDENGLIELSTGASNSEYAGMSEWSFTLACRQSAETPTYVEKVLKEYCDAKSVGVIYLNDDWGVSVMEQIESACDKLDIEITAAENFVEGEKDFTSMLTKIRQTNPEYLALATQSEAGALILQQVKATGWDIPVTGVGAMYSDQTIDLAGAAAEGLIINSPVFISEEDEKAWAYAQRFEQASGFMPSTFGPNGYDAAMVLCDAIERAGSTDRKAVRDALQATSGFDGGLADVTFTEIGDVIRECCVLQVQDGQWHALSDFSRVSDDLLIKMGVL